MLGMDANRPVEILVPRQPLDYDAIRGLFIEYAESLGFSLGYQEFDDELAKLPGKYAPPTGALLIARVDGAVAGTAALRRLAEDICEMKRLYVRPEFRGTRTVEGLSIGRALALAVVTHARALGYRTLRLDSVVGKMDVAIRLYRSIGFVEIPAYYPSPIPNTIYLELIL
jgi:ribosomal protein S18 acetylase RimI-like enzyme